MTDISTYNQLQRDNKYKKFEASFKRWGVTISNVYIEDDSGQQRLRDAIDNHERVWIKLVRNKDFGTRGYRTVRIGMGFLVNVGIQQSIQDAVNNNFAILGTGPLQRMLEKQSNLITCNNICCEELNENIYMFNGQTFEAPPAPKGSTGWIVEKTFEPIETGTGDIGTITLNASGAGLSGCPVHVVYRYLCKDSAYIPSNSLTAYEQFVEIADKTTNFSQIQIIKKLASLVGITLGHNGNASDVWILLTYSFFPANPDYILDLSNMRLSDLTIVGTLTGLTGVNISYNDLSFTDIESIQDLELKYLKADHNLLGQWSSALVNFADTIKYLDLSYNFITEQFLFSNFTSAPNPSTLDYFNFNKNICSFWINQKLKVKELYFALNRYPLDSFYRNGYWESRLTTANSSTLIASVFPQLCKDFTILEKLDISELQLSPSDDISALITAISTDRAESVAIATSRVTYSPKYTEILPVEQFNPLALPRTWLT
jgi:hypothetical protein